VADFAGQCWLWQLLDLVTFAAAELGLPTELGWSNLGFYQLLQANSTPKEF
jgi:hypothetical protein